MAKEESDSKRLRRALSQTGHGFCENITMHGFGYWVNSGKGGK